MDYFKFTLEEDRIINVVVDSISRNLDFGMDLLDREGFDIKYKITQDGSNITLGYFLAAGDYYISFKDIYSIGSSDLPMVFSVNDYIVDKNENNNTWETSTEISLGDTITGTLFPSEDLDLFKIEIKDTVSTLKFEFNSLPTVENTYFRLYDSGKNKVIAQSIRTDSYSTSRELFPGIYYASIELGLAKSSEKIYNFVVTEEEAEAVVTMDDVVK